VLHRVKRLILSDTLFPASMESFITSMLIKANITIFGTLSYQIPKIRGVWLDFVSGRDAHAHLKSVHERERQRGRVERQARSCSKSKGSTNASGDSPADGNEHDGTSRIRELAVICYGGRGGEGRKKRGSRELLKTRRGTNASLYLSRASSWQIW
jgi:hypothetical protein